MTKVYLHMKDRLYTSYVRSTMFCSCETWPAKDDAVKSQEHTEKSMVRLICNATVRDCPESEMRSRHGTDSISEIMRTS